MSVDEIRKAIVDALPSDTSLSGAFPRLEWVYLPVSHVKALGLETSLVIGTRGVGKSFWWAALQSAQIRESLSQYLPELPRFDVSAGYGEKANSRSYPDMETFGYLIGQGHEPLSIWRGVATRWVRAVLSEEKPSETWNETVSSVRNDPESFARAMESADSYFRNEKRQGLILFDALDRTSHDWRTMDRIVRDLLRFILYIKPFDNLHAKIFLREDQFEGRNVGNFPDASKLLSTRIDLTWGLLDLHGLLWQYLINGSTDSARKIRLLLKTSTGLDAPNVKGVFRLPEKLRRDESVQRRSFVELAGEWMGRGPRRGKPYTWSVSHLADGRGRVSPRSFIAAIRSAAEDSLVRYHDHYCPLHYESIKRGVQKASEIRVYELAEDYPWIVSLMKPLEGLTVPCPFSEIERRWSHSGVLDGKAFKGERLPPEHLEEGAEGVRRDLESLGIFERMRDQRVNMPDLYRVGFRLGRRGGVRPVARTPRA